MRTFVLKDGEINERRDGKKFVTIAERREEWRRRRAIALEKTRRKSEQKPSPWSEKPVTFFHVSLSS